MAYGQGNGPHDQPWEPGYDPRDPGQRLRGPQGQPPPEGPPPWQQPGYGQQPYQGQSQYPPQGQPWPQQSYRPPQGPPPGWQPGYGQQPPWGTPPGPPQPPHRKRHTGRNILIGAGGLVVLIIAVAVAASGGKTVSTGASATSSPAASRVASAEAAAQDCTASGGTWNGTSCQTAATSPSAAPPTKVEFIVSGTAPDGIDITYGPDGSQLQGPSTIDGTVTMSVPFDGSADFYALNAQLQGGGSITCKIVATGPGDNPLTVSHGAASGSYNICSAQAAPTDSTGLSWTNEE